MAKTIRTTFKLRRGSAKAWEKNNPILEYGEPGFDKDNGYLKIGDGSKQWLELLPINTKIQPDWEQWDSTQPDYIKGRTHYINKYYPDSSDVYEFDVDDVNVGFSIKGYYTPPAYPVGGLTYPWRDSRVIINEQVYVVDQITEIKSGSIWPSYYLGNVHLINPDYEDTGEPFVITGTRKDSEIYFKEPGHYTIQIKEKELAEEIVTIPELFLPQKVNNLITKMQVEESSLFLELPDSWGAETTRTICMGTELTKQYSGVIILGQYNDVPGRITIRSLTSSTGDSTFQYFTEWLFILGNGESKTKRSNAFGINTKGEPWSKGRPYFGGNGDGKDIQTVVANGDSEIILKSGENEFIIDVDNNGVLKAVKNEYNPKYEYYFSINNDGFSFKLYLKGLNKKRIISATLSYWVTYGSGNPEQRIQDLVIFNNPDLSADYYSSAGAYYSSNQPEMSASFSGHKLTIKYKDLEDKEQIFETSVIGSLDSWTSLEE